MDFMWVPFPSDKLTADTQSTQVTREINFE
jgi:hypothetical protein